MTTCEVLSAKIAELQPHLTPVEVARVCLLIFNQAGPDIDLADSDVLRQHWQSASFRLGAAADQHAAMAAELENLCTEGPVRFSADQIWILLRSVKIQSQTIELYTGKPAVVF